MRIFLTFRPGALLRFLFSAPQEIHLRLYDPRHSLILHKLRLLLLGTLRQILILAPEILWKGEIRVNFPSTCVE